MRKDILSVENITMQFGGVVAVNNLSLHIPRGADRGAHRPERRRKDHGLQLHHRRIRADERPRQIP